MILYLIIYAIAGTILSAERGAAPGGGQPSRVHRRVRGRAGGGQYPSINLKPARMRACRREWTTGSSGWWGGGRRPLLQV